MAAVGLNPSDREEKEAFHRLFRGDTGQVQTKVRSKLFDDFFESLLTLEEVPPIVSAGDPEPPNMPVHLAKFPMLKAPPEGFSANNVRYKYSSYWHAEVSNRRTAEGSRQLLNFKKGTCVFAKSNQIACCPVACALTQTVPILLPSLCLACAARRSLGALALALAARSSSSRPISSPVPS